MTEKTKRRPGRIPANLHRRGFTFSPIADQSLMRLHEREYEIDPRTTLTKIVEDAIIARAKALGL